MAKMRMLVDLQRCSGCWTCAAACKIGNVLADDQWWLTVKTLGCGEGIDRPSGIWPNLRMSWMPLYTKECVFCGERVAGGDAPYCAYNCPARALTFGDIEDAESEISSKIEELKGKGYRVFTLPAWENTKSSIIYASRK